jgi:hypothetical protein
LALSAGVLTEQIVCPVQTDFLKIGFKKVLLKISKTTLHRFGTLTYNLH